MSDPEKPSWEWRALVVEMRAELDGAEHQLAASVPLAEHNRIEAQLATVTQERDALRLRITAVDAERAQLAEDRRKMSEEYEAWCLDDV